MQYFKGDADELKMIECATEITDLLSAQIDLFLDGAYSTAPLGDMIYESGRAPLSNAILQSIFRDCFAEVFEAFTVAGSFESYILVFQKIFGDDVEIEFTVPGPGQLQIDITGTGIELSTFVAREIISGAYSFDPVIDQVDDNIMFQTVKGFQSQYELEQMLFEMVPAGIFTEISLTLG